MYCAGGANDKAKAVAGPENNYGFPPGFGVAGSDFPLVDPNNIPTTSFSCDDKDASG